MQSEQSNHSVSNLVFLLVFSLVIGLVGCSGGGGGGGGGGGQPKPNPSPDPDPGELDVTGTWEVTFVEDGETEISEVELTQSGNQVSFVETQEGQTVVGTLSDRQLTATWEIDFGFGIETNQVNITISTDGMAFTGTQTYDYVDLFDPFFNYSGTIQLNAQRLTTINPTPPGGGACSGPRGFVYSGEHAAVVHALLELYFDGLNDRPLLEDVVWPQTISCTDEYTTVEVCRHRPLARAVATPTSALRSHWHGLRRRMLERVAPAPALLQRRQRA